MIEIFILISVYRSLARRAEEKGRSSAFGWLGVGAWVVGQFLGALIAVLMGMNGFSIYIVALPMALLALGGAYYIVNRLDAAPDTVKAEAFD